MAISFPLDTTSTTQADDVFYCLHAGDADLFDAGGGRIPLKSGDPRCSEWCDLYEAIFGHNKNGAPDFPDCGKGHEHHPADCAHCKADTPDPKPKPKPKPPTDPVNPVEPCPLVGYKLVELIEVVTQDKDKWVEGPMKAATEKSVTTQGVARTEKNGGLFKQFINLDPDAEGAAKRHPDYGRAITFRARVEQIDGCADKLAGAKVTFSHARVDGPNRADPGGTEPAVWIAPGLTGAQKEGFGSANGAATKTLATDAKGWTGPITFHLSQFAGDQFSISAALHASEKGADTSPTLTTAGNYQVWRRFWYQMSHAKGFAAVEPTAGAAAYAEVFADMILANTREFEKTDFPADLQDRTFQPEFQFKTGGGADIVANIGTSNVGEFYTNAALKLQKPVSEPLKDILIACEFQIDPAGKTPVSLQKMTSASKTFTMPAGTNGAEIISKPPVKAAAALVGKGEYATRKFPWTKLGALTDADITIEQGRAGTMDVKVTLPAGAPTPTAASPVWIKLSVEAGESFLGWAPAKGGVVAVYVPGTAAGKQKSKEDFNDTAAHEFAHQFNQTARPGNQPASLKNHPMQYLGHGGSGSHCRHGATVAPGPVNWQNAAQSSPAPRKGDCLEFATYSSKCSHKFCPICRIHMQLETMEKFG